MATQDADRRSAEALVLEHLPDIVTLCNRMCRQRSDAEDAVHEAVLAILRALPGYRGEGPVRHWVLKVALNAARQHRRGRNRTARREDALPEAGLPGDDMPDPTEQREERESLRAAIAELPEDIRETVTLYYFHNLTQAQIAECVGCTQKTVHVRVKKGLDLLSRRLVGNAAFAAMIAGGGTGKALLDAVSPALIASVQKTVAGHFAAGAATAAATATQSAASTATTAGAATGGIVMNAKLYTAATVLAVTCLIGGAVLSNAVFADGDDDAHAAQIAALRAQIEDGARDVTALEKNLESESRRGSARIAELTRELRSARTQLADRDGQLAALKAAAEHTPTSGAVRTQSREEQWAELEKTMAAILDIMMKMEQEGANQFELGPLMVAELGKLTAEDYEKLLAFDTDETDPLRVETIRAVMLQALIFRPEVEQYRDEYMGRYIERVRQGGFGDSFDRGALRRLSFRMPPFVDAYKKLIAPMDEDLRRQYVDLALERTTNGPTDAHRYDGLVFLGRTVDDPRATEALKDVYRQPANNPQLRIAAVRALVDHADEDVLSLLRDAEGTEQDARVLDEVKKAAGQVEQRIAKER